jgi:hypothetical protein
MSAIMTSRQAAELDHAFERNGWTSGMVKGLSQGDSLTRVREYLFKEELITWFDTTTTSATAEEFVAKDKFREDSEEVKFYGIWDNFTNWFLAGNGKIEEPLGEQELRYGNLTKNSVDGPIIDELGGEAKVETTLTELYDLLKRQANGEEGVLLTNGYANIFYIRDTSGVLRAVRVGRLDDGWLVIAYSVETPHAWSAGRRVFSRNS